MTADVLAAGAVLWRPCAHRGAAADGVEIALVHRPRYDDWSLPKGKLEPGESMAAAAVREVREETGVSARLGAHLEDVHYPVPEGRKLVRYWAAQVQHATPFVPSAETDALRWVPPEEAVGLLTYPHDAHVVHRFAGIGPPTSVLLLVRHAKAGSRDQWDGDDLRRPLSGTGRKQAHDLAGLLRLFGPDRIASAPVLRCRDTVVPLADALELPIGDEPLLEEGRFAEDPAAGLGRIRDLVAEPGVTVACSQGAVIPDVVGHLVRGAARKVGVDPDDVPAKKASTWVLGLRDGALVSADYHQRPTD